MKNLLKLDELILELNSNNKFTVKEINLNIYSENIDIGYVNLIIVKESSSQNNLEAYLDQLESEDINANQLKYLKLKDADYGTELESGDLIFIDEIYLKEKYRGKKYGTNILKELISYAKANNINRLVLSPQPIGLNKNDKSFQKRSLTLESWYNKYGFITYSANNKFKYMINILS